MCVAHFPANQPPNSSRVVWCSTDTEKHIHAMYRGGVWYREKFANGDPCGMEEVFEPRDWCEVVWDVEEEDKDETFTVFAI